MGATDGTQLNPGASGDLIADEDLTGQPRQSPLVPQLGAANAGYKLERTKIAVGEYGQDRGDATADGVRFPVEMPAERRLLEATMLAQIDAARLAGATRQRERQPSLTFNTRIGRSGRDGV